MVTSPLLEEVVQARRATICEEEPPKELSGLVEKDEHVNDTSFEAEVNELTMAFNFLTLKYKDEQLEQRFSAHVGPHSLLIVEVILSILSLLLIYIYFLKHQIIRTSIAMGIIIGIQLILTLGLLRFHRTVLNWWILRHFIASFYLLSPLILILCQLFDYDLTSPAFFLFISTYLTLGASLSHLIKVLIAIISIAIYLPLIYFKNQRLSLFSIHEREKHANIRFF